jgi:hypothetical protein
MERLLEVTIGDRDVAFRRKHNCEGLLVGRCNSVERGYDGFGCEDGDIVDGHDKCADIFTSNIANSRCRRMQDNTRNVSVCPDVTILDLEAEARVFAHDRAGQFVEELEGIIRNVEVEGRNVQFVRSR